MRIVSSAFRDGEAIPQQYASERGGGRNVSPPFELSDVPAGTRSLALVITDLSPVARGFVHWLVVDMDARTGSIAEGASGAGMLKGARELLNDFGERGYGGPKPPPGTGIHTYETTVYALDVPHLDVAEGSGLAEFENEVDGHVLASASYAGLMGH